MHRVVVVVVIAACTSKPQAPVPKQGAPAPRVASGLPAGPVPVALPALDAAQRRTLSHADGYLTIDARGVIRWGLDMAGAKPFEGTVLERDDSPFGQLFPVPEERGHEHHAIRSEHVVELDLDAYAVLTHDPSTEVIILADAAVPARITMRKALEGFGYHASTLAVGAANTAVLYRFGGEPWQSPDTEPELALHVDNLVALAAQHPKRVVLELTNDTTTGQLVAALGVLGAAGVENVRLYRMMGWGDIAPDEILRFNGSTSDDDEITTSDPPKVKIADAVVDGGLAQLGVDAALRSWQDRFRYCFEKRHLAPKVHGTVTLSFNVAADGVISHAKATGLDAKIDSCVAGAVFDLDITPAAIEGAGHASAAITFTPPEVAEPAPEPLPPHGFWCWTDGDVGLCAHRQEECEVALDAYSQTGASLGEPVHATPCKPQRTAWTDDGEHWKPTKKLCGRGCKQVR